MRKWFSWTFTLYYQLCLVLIVDMFIRKRAGKHTSALMLEYIVFIIVLVCENNGENNFKESLSTSQQPWNVVWNSPSYVCHQYGVDLGLKGYGIITNNQEQFSGENMVIFYENQLGLYPKLWSDDTPYNGGVPQNVNFTAHFAKAKIDIVKMIPDEDFGGLSVIDWESWTPLWNGNYDSKKKYQDFSIAQVQKNHPGWSKAQVTQEATKQFEESARTLMEGTLLLARTLRPRGQWGFYIYPSCQNYHRYHRNCTNQTIVDNNRMSWMFNASTALYPSVYIPTDPSHSHDVFLFELHMIGEAIRIRSYISKPYLPIHLYTRYRHSDTNKFYTKEDLLISLGLSSNMALHGAVLWGASKNLHNESECMNLHKFVKSYLGPITQILIYNATDCSKKLCNSHGRCYSNFTNSLINMVHEAFSDMDLYYKVRKSSHHQIDIMKLKFLNYILEVDGNTDSKAIYSCVCYKNWSGNNCDRHL